jgi:FkbM family methyltransferase
MLAPMNFSGISKDTLLGKLLRSPLKLIPPSAVVPILQGPLRGKKWIAGSSTNGCWVGSFEYEKRQVFQRVVGPGDVVYDLGANVGFYSLLASVLVGDQGHVYCFEPLPANISLLKRHVELNGIGNCTIVEAAVTAEDGWAHFDASGHPSMAHLSETGPSTVRTVRLDSLVESRELLPPKVLKIDVEGAEFAALGGAARTIDRHRPAIFLATHGAGVHQDCLRFLSHRGYRLTSLSAEPVESSPELLARVDPVPTM